ncbi:response regulator transcription factor [Nocardia huaxiensis]|uniref:Response regulator n=1 Tax=Nocardia huaxiensis TaxID=2755382 RepID=A0A7D6VEP9_9NOCA|nr:response regulator [Nocardia huaxiensis]QLY33671.1 response regulator [Nocardia huaxiensis]UFS99413.1 response regulator [Nocardia huaxiensis]
MSDDGTTARSVWVLVCEDDDRLGEQVAIGLRDAGFTVDLTRNLADAGLRFGRHRYDCLVIDRGLPDGDGLDLIRRQRESGGQTPALVITARDSPADRAAGYLSGADDFLAKPFSLSELSARVRALCTRRTRPSPILTVGDVVVDRVRRRVLRGGVLLTVSAREFCALELLATRVGTRVSATEMVEYCPEAHTPADSIAETVARLERKLGAPRLIDATDEGYLLQA